MAIFKPGFVISGGITAKPTLTPLTVSGTVADDTWFTPQVNTLTVNNSIGVITATVTSGSLPPGFTVNTSGGNVIILGIPT